MSTTCSYADGVESVSFQEGMLRLELFCYGPPGEDGKATRQSAGRLVLPPAGFLRAYEAMGELVRRLRASGLVEPNAARREVDAETSAPSKVATANSPCSSPNFS